MLKKLNSIVSQSFNLGALDADENIDGSECYEDPDGLPEKLPDTDLHQDTEFCCSRPKKVLGFDGSDVEWLRPHEIVKKPVLFADGGSQFDVVQGSLGDCWLLAAMAPLSMDETLVKRVIPDGQSFDEGYNGSFYFNIYQFGKWVKVVIDDRLPTKNGKLIYTSSADENEFWSALLEKAYRDGSNFSTF